MIKLFCPLVTLTLQEKGRYDRTRQKNHDKQRFRSREYHRKNPSDNVLGNIYMRGKQVVCQQANIILDAVSGFLENGIIKHLT